LFVVWWISRAKKYAVAENSPAVSGVHTSHLPEGSLTNTSFITTSRMNIRTWGKFAAAISSAWRSTPHQYRSVSGTPPPMRISMFDWPDPSHTSPATTSRRTSTAVVRSPATLNSTGPAALIGGRRTCHAPLESTVVDCS